MRFRTFISVINLQGILTQTQFHPRREIDFHNIDSENLRLTVIARADPAQSNGTSGPFFQKGKTKEIHLFYFLNFTCSGYFGDAKLSENFRHDAE